MLQADPDTVWRRRIVKVCSRDCNMAWELGPLCAGGVADLRDNLAGILSSCKGGYLTFLQIVGAGHNAADM